MSKRNAWTLPETVEGVAGRLWVRSVPNLKSSDGVRSLGTWDDATRVLKVDSGMVGDMVERVFYHELTHSALDDTGCHALFSARITEAVCDAMGTAMLRFRKGGAFGP